MSQLGDIKIGRVNQTLPGYISIRCDRKTPLGNPYWMANESQRADVCRRFNMYLPLLDKQHGRAHDMLNEIIMHVELGKNVLLQCHCYPKQCHTESIRDYVLNYIQSSQGK